MSQQQPKAASSPLTIDIDNRQLIVTLGLLEKVEAAAKSAGAALAAIGVATPLPLTDLVVGELVVDEAQQLILAELRKQTDLLTVLRQYQDDEAVMKELTRLI